MIGLDLDGVLCDLGPAVSARITQRFGVVSHPSTWRTYDLRQLPLGLPKQAFNALLDDCFVDPALYEDAPVVEGARAGVSCLVQAGWEVCAITARPPEVAVATRRWLARHRFAISQVHHTQVGTKFMVAQEVGALACLEDNPAEAESLARVCESLLLDRPYNRDQAVHHARRVVSWDDAVGRLCQLRLFA
ncbi:MAG: 5' nucleotidase, NT5C type [Acidimicrobiales bacterium]